MLGLLNPLVGWLAVAGLVAASYGAAYWKGRIDGWEKRDEVAATEAREAERLLAKVAAVRQRITREAAQVYRERIRVVYQDREVIREIRIPDRCELSAEWVRLHDTAAGFSDATTGIDGGAEAARAAQVVSDNYLACRENTQKLISLQEWISRQAKTK